jgi:hypothetical protein
VNKMTASRAVKKRVSLVAFTILLGCLTGVAEAKIKLAIGSDYIPPPPPSSDRPKEADRDKQKTGDEKTTEDPAILQKESIEQTGPGEPSVLPTNEERPGSQSNQDFTRGY